MSGGAAAAFAAALRAALAEIGAPDARLGLAVSGGGDSMALMHLAAGLLPPERLAVATVDHRLRADAADEAAFVARAASALGLTHETLVWEGAAQGGNLMARARAARYRLLSDWLARTGAAALLTAHTRDDQAETLLINLGRGSGIDGLSAMAPVSFAHGRPVIRPLLAVSRDALRAELRARGAAWIEDPANDDPARARARARSAIAALETLGVTAEGLARTAGVLRGQRAALDAAAAEALAAMSAPGAAGEIAIDLGGHASLPADLRWRCLAALLRDAGTRKAHRPRQEALEALDAALLAGLPDGARALSGAIVAPLGPGRAAFCREPAAAEEPAPLADGAALWDGRWRIEAPGAPQGVEVSALGEDGLAALARLAREGLWTPPPGWAAAPRPARAATPGLRASGRLIAAPVAGFGEARARRLPPPGSKRG